ncbi:MAG: hypothetical protein BMS9Abin06_0004 [Gammaproteobacteria bacterium]|nr:MAG: hypothetical protein BMS9Abin06_0004 [Gammaproteobacteria bacterium]
MGAILITSKLGENFREDLEQMMFFNEEQYKAEAGIRNCVERYGVPEITTENGYLRIRVNAFSITQALFAIDRTESEDILSGVIVYVRDTVDNISILHIAIAENSALTGPVKTARLILDLLHQVIDSASRINGVKNVKLVYGMASDNGKGSFRNIPVSRRSCRHRTEKINNQCPDK